jgi:hypothetical protein
MLLGLCLSMAATRPVFSKYLALPHNRSCELTVPPYACMHLCRPGDAGGDAGQPVVLLRNMPELLAEDDVDGAGDDAGAMAANEKE